SQCLYQPKTSLNPADASRKWPFQLDDIRVGTAKARPSRLFSRNHMKQNKYKQTIKLFHIYNRKIIIQCLHPALKYIHTSCKKYIHASTHNIKVEPPPRLAGSNKNEPPPRLAGSNKNEPPPRLAGLNKDEPPPRLAGSYLNKKL
ncbi:hypothetical protein Taro_019248, partial [Colocasia esculenta]|nr:hypothetical protein [Colocasia esculenta]